MYQNPCVLNDLRRSIHRLGHDLGRPIWVAEVDGQELGRSPEEIQIACLERVRRLEEFICIVDGSYGTPWNLAELCVLELEIIVATLAGKRFHFFLLSPYDADSRTESLLRVVRKVRPDVATTKPLGADEILCTLSQRLKGTRSRRAHRVDNPVDSNQDPWLQSERDLDVLFLDGSFAPLDEDSPGDSLESLVRQVLARISAGKDHSTRLVYAWMAIRRLSAAPYSNSECVRFLPLWEEALSQWARAAAWYGLHGHHFLGRLAALNTLLLIRKRLAAPSACSSAPSIHATGGALASEYLSMAKSVQSKSLKLILRRRALGAVNAALQENHQDHSGLLAIRGSALQALGHLHAGLREYRKVLHLRLAAGEDLGRIGEAESELGWGYLLCSVLDPWLFARARHLLTHGAALLRNTDRFEFTVRALRKLGIFHLITLNLSGARRTLESAVAIARSKEVRGQLRQIMPILRILNLLDWRTWLRGAGPVT